MKDDSAGQLIRWSTVAAVTVVAVVAGWVSYDHAYEVVTRFGETGAVARVYPGTIDGLIYAASMVLLDAARRGISRVPWLAVTALAVGIAATLTANVAAGLEHGVPGAILAAWPAPALVLSYELLMWLVRTAASEMPSESVSEPVTEPIAEPVTAEAIEPVSVVPSKPVIARAAARSTNRPRRKHAGKSRRGGSLPQRKAARAALEAEAVAILDAEPGIGPTELAARLDCSVSTAQRLRKEIRTVQPVGQVSSL